MNINDYMIGQTYAEAIFVTRETVLGFASISGDKNPIHVDENFAKNSFYKKNIAHGMLLAAFISKIFGMNFPGPGCIYGSQSFKFLKPVFIDDDLLVVVKITEIDLVKSKLTFSTVCSVNDVEVLVGEAKIYIPKGMNK